jgi:hypothetical protein
MEISIRELRKRPKYQTERIQAMSDEEFASKYIAAMKREGVDVTVTGINDPDAPDTNVFEDLTKAIGAGANSALAGIIGLPGALTNTVEMGMDKLGMGSRDADNRAFGFPEATAAINQVREKLPPFLAGTDPTFEPQTRAGRMLKTGSELAASGGAGGARKMAQQVLAPTLLSEGGKEAFEGTILETPAQIAGLMAGGKALDVAENTLAGGKVDPRRLEAVDTLRNAGIEPTAGQATGQPSLAFAEEATQSGRAKRQGAVDQFTDAAITQAIPPSFRDRVQFEPGMMPQEKMEKLRTTLTSTMDELAARNSVPITTELFEEVFEVAQDYKKILSTSEKSPFFEIFAEDMVNRAGAGQIPGSEFQRIRSQLSELTTKDQITKNAAVKVIRALEAAMGKQIAKGRNTEDIALYRDVRKGYSDLMVLEDAAKRNRDTGFNISPAALANAARKKDAQSYVYGRDTFSDLYRAADDVLSAAGNPSGTANTLKALMGPTFAMGAAGSAATATGIPFPAAMAGALAAPLVRNKALQSNVAQEYFKRTMRPGERAPTASVPGILVGLQELQQQMR